MLNVYYSILHPNYYPGIPNNSCTQPLLQIGSLGDGIGPYFYTFIDMTGVVIHYSDNKRNTESIVFAFAVNACLSQQFGKPLSLVTDKRAD